MPSQSSQKKKNFQKPAVIFPPETILEIQAGVNQLLNAIQPTLGPFSRHIAVQPFLSSKPPELLDSGGTIARRITQIKNRGQDVGLMFARHMLWELQDKVGDGTATAAVIFQEILNQGVRYIAAGGDAIRLRMYLHRGLNQILSELDRQISPLAGEHQFVGLADGICNDQELANHIANVFETIGPYGRIEVRTGQTREVRHEFVQGVYWEGGPISPEMFTNKSEMRTQFYNGALLATDLDIKEPIETIEMLETALSAGITQLLIVVGSISDRALAPLLNLDNQKQIQVLVVKLPGADLERQKTNLFDLALLTGGRPVYKVTQIRPKDIRKVDFGFARHIWCHSNVFGIIGGKGDPGALRTRVKLLQKAILEMKEINEAENILDRLGHLMNGSATLWIGALTQDAYQKRKKCAERMIRSLRMALLKGVLPGGGIALLACLPALEARIRETIDTDAIAAYRILTKALQAPSRIMLENAGYESGKLLSATDKFDIGYGIDLRNGQMVDMHKAGIVDPAPVVKEAIRAAITSAALLLTTDILVHKRNPDEAQSIV